jgi:hypothetical protein
MSTTEPLKYPSETITLDPIPTEPMPTTVKHMANLGDIIAVMPACKKYYDITKRKVHFLQRKNVKAAYYQGAVHPTVDENGENVCINQAMFDMIKPLIDVQPYIHAFDSYEGQNVHLDFDVIREKTFVNMPNGSIQAWIFYAFPDLACDLTQPWISLPEESHPVQDQTRGKIVLNFTERYRNQITDYFFLKKHAPDLVFSGTEREHWLFCNAWQLNVPRLQVTNFLELAYALKACRFTMSNQSMLWNMCEAMQIPRILEVCRYAPNCMPFYSEHSVGFYHQVGAEYYFKVFDNKY